MGRLTEGAPSTEQRDTEQALNAYHWLESLPPAACSAPANRMERCEVVPSIDMILFSGKLKIL
jgi:hypothetical protein